MFGPIEDRSDGVFKLEALACRVSDEGSYGPSAGGVMRYWFSRVSHILRKTKSYSIDKLSHINYETSIHSDTNGVKLKCLHIALYGFTYIDKIKNCLFDDFIFITLTGENRGGCSDFKFLIR